MLVLSIPLKQKFRMVYSNNAIGNVFASDKRSLERKQTGKRYASATTDKDNDDEESDDGQ